MSKIYLKQLIREVIQEFEISKDDIEIEPDFSFGEYAHDNLDSGSIEVEGLTSDWYGVDLSEVFISYAKWNDGTELTDEELDQLNMVDEFIVLAQEKAVEDYYL